MPYAVLFPGQGAQFVGMGAELFAARSDLLGPGADAVLGWSLSEICADGPEEELTATEKAQPALYAVSFALWATLSDAGAGVPAAAAGHSLGEYTALAAAGAFGFLDGLALVAARGRAMAAAASLEPSGMAALIGADEASAEALCAVRRQGGGRLWVANLNAPGQVVVAGAAADIAWAVENGREHGVRRVVPLNVSGAFHSPIMAPAAEALRAAIDATEIDDLDFDVWGNTSAAPIVDVAAALAGQLVGTVRFSDTLQTMAAVGIDTFVHVGPGDVTAGLARRTVPEATVLTVSTVDDIAAAAPALVT